MSMHKLSRWLLFAAVAAPAVVADGTVSFAQATGGESATMNMVDHAVRTGDFNRAATLLQKAAESGNAEAQYRLASLYRAGRGVPQDEPLAFKWMKAAAERNHVNAQFNLATMYLAGRGVAPDISQAKVWLQKAASRGHDEATKLLAEVSTRRVADPSASNSAQASAAEGQRGPAKIEPTAQRGSATVVGIDPTEILGAAWRGQTDA